MQQTCRQCKTAFTVTDRELAFYEKASPTFPSASLGAGSGKKYAIPPPTLCPDCRQQRRCAFRNERIYYRRACDMTGRSILSVYPDDALFPVYSAEAWWGDGWDGRDYGQELSLEESFFTQFEKLQNKVPRLHFSSTDSENSEYCNHVGFMKDCYLVVGSVSSEKCLYGTRIFTSRDCVDCLWIDHCELCYECVDCVECYNVSFAEQCRSVHDSWYVNNCNGSSDLLFCVNTRQSKNQILNKQYEPEDFATLKEKIFSTESLFKEHMRKFQALVASTPVRAAIIRMSENCTGNYIVESQNSHHAFDVRKTQDVTYAYDVIDIKDSMDLYSFYGPGELCYDAYSGAIGINRCLFFRDCWPGDNLLYCDHCFHCSDCLGCTGLRHKQYCILNKQYTKEEYETLAPKLIEHMRKTREWGEFFPIPLSPFAYNESAAQEFFPLTKEAALHKGYRWRDQEERVPETQKAILASALPKNIDISDDVLQLAITCEVTGRPFRIIKQELEFYRKQHLGLPHLHPDERHRQRVAKRNPPKLYDRSCAHCKKSIRTSYAPNRPEIVYCEECYLKEVY